MNSLMYNEKEINQRGEMLSLTDMWRATGGDPNKRPGDWTRKEGSTFIDYLQSTMPVGEGDLIKAENKGGVWNTWAHWRIALEYCRYLSLSCLYNKIIMKFSPNEPLKEFRVLHRRSEIFFKDMLIDLINNTPVISCLNLTVIHQFSIGKYFIDFYIPEIRLAIEYDEEHHKYNRNKESDIERQEFLEKILKCKFVRVKKGNEGSGIANILFAIGSISHSDICGDRQDEFNAFQKQRRRLPGRQPYLQFDGVA